MAETTNRLSATQTGQHPWSLDAPDTGDGSPDSESRLSSDYTKALDRRSPLQPETEVRVDLRSPRLRKNQRKHVGSTGSLSILSPASIGGIIIATVGLKGRIS
ncbi:hypothetical protein BDV11DRAFT_179770 [Aspergillus similis]